MMNKTNLLIGLGLCAAVPSYAHTGHGLESQSTLLHMLSSFQHGWAFYAAAGITLYLLASVLRNRRARKAIDRTNV